MLVFPRREDPFWSMMLGVWAHTQNPSFLWQLGWQAHTLDVAQMGSPFFILFAKKSFFLHSNIQKSPIKKVIPHQTKPFRAADLIVWLGKFWIKTRGQISPRAQFFSAVR